MLFIIVHYNTIFHKPDIANTCPVYTSNYHSAFQIPDNYLKAFKKECEKNDEVSLIRVFKLTEIYKPEVYDYGTEVNY